MWILLTTLYVITYMGAGSVEIKGETVQEFLTLKECKRNMKVWEKRMVVEGLGIPHATCVQVYYK